MRTSSAAPTAADQSQTSVETIVVMCKLRARKQSLRKIQNEMARRGFALSYQGVKRVLARQKEAA